MKNLSFILYFLIFFQLKAISQNNVHGPSVKFGYSTLEKYSFGVGYNFLKFKDDWGWSRPAHNYYFEYIPEHKAFGLSANLQYTLLFVEAGIEAGFRSKNENNDSYFLFYPHIGFDLINVDLSFGPELLTYKPNGNNISFKVTLKIHPKLFNQKTNRLKFEKD